MSSAEFVKQSGIPVTLDEDVYSFESARIDLEIGACTGVMVKVGRVAVLMRRVPIHEYCVQQGKIMIVGRLVDDQSCAPFHLCLPDSVSSNIRRRDYARR